MYMLLFSSCNALLYKSGKTYWQSITSLLKSLYISCEIETFLLLLCGFLSQFIIVMLLEKWQHAS